MPHDQSSSRGGREECLVEVTVETKLLTVWGSATADGGLWGSWAEGRGYQEDSHIPRGRGARGPRGLCPLGQAILLMRGRHLRLRGGEEKGQHTMKASESRALLLALWLGHVCFLSTHLELESQLCDFLIGQNVPASFLPAFTNKLKGTQVSSESHAQITFFKNPHPSCPNSDSQ